MKKVTVFLVFLGLTVGNQASAQEPTTTASTKVGVRGGLSFSNLYTKDVDDKNRLTGLTAGFFIEAPISNNVAFQPEFNFTMKGAELQYNNVFAQGKTKFGLSYLEMPVLIKANILPMVNVHFGPYFAYLVDARITNEDPNGNINFEQTYNEDDFNRFDYGLSGGVGLDFGPLGIGARYNYGLRTIGKEQTFGGVTYTFPDGKNSNFNLYATLKF
ncbi:MAG: hypothetical protein RLZZ500_652 [Bacteroidota bacterium]|jgi:hypothetical protein